MTRSRSIDDDNDWTFGKGRNDYQRNIRAVEQNIRTRLNSFLGDCFTDQTAGLDWFNLLASKDQLALSLAISAVILNTEEVTGLTQLLIDLNPITRGLSVRYQVQTTYSPLSAQFLLNVNLVSG